MLKKKPLKPLNADELLLLMRLLANPLLFSLTDMHCITIQNILPTELLHAQEHPVSLRGL